MPPLLVSVIGAGAAELFTAREGHKVVVFERGNQVGGTWVYTPEVESDPLGSDPRRTMVHSSVYASLRTNLPREAMGFTDYPFVAKKELGRDPRRFPGHREVLMYLQDFARDFQIEEMVRFETEAVRCRLVEGGRWEVRSRLKEEEMKCVRDEIYDAVVVCAGHYSEPYLPDDIPGLSSWPGKQMHSHNYRLPKPFQDQIVILIGNSASAHDISRDIAGVAKEVHVARRSSGAAICEKEPGYDNMWLHPMIKQACEDGTVIFQDGSSVRADTILHCTGYKYHFPFLETNGLVTIHDHWLWPLYKHMFPPASAPTLSFVGISWKVIPFPMFEMQGKWIAGVLSGRIPLPSRKEMMEEVEEFYSMLEASGIPKRYTHKIESYQFEYTGSLAAQCGYMAPEKWRKEMFVVNGKNRFMHPDTYRDELEDTHPLVLQSHEDFSKYITMEAK